MNNDKNSHQITPSGTTAHPEQTVPDNKQGNTHSAGIKFSPGEIVTTTNAFNQLSMDDIAKGLARHLFGDWGEICDEDWEQNQDALTYGNRLHSVYTSAGGIKFWIITECDRSVTTILLPDDY